MSLNYQPKQCTIFLSREIPQNYHTFAAIGDPSQIGDFLAFPKIVVPQTGWFIMENPIFQWDDLGVPLFSETSI